MEGVQEVKELRGIIPNSFEHVFDHITLSPGNKEYLVRASYLEIYNEQIRDLLSETHETKLDLKEHPEKGVYIKVRKTSTRIIETGSVRNCCKKYI
jgi:hypothetical protein